MWFHLLGGLCRAIGVQQLLPATMMANSSLTHGGTVSCHHGGALIGFKLLL
jgi:hypothetical protein